MNTPLNGISSADYTAAETPDANISRRGKIDVETLGGFRAVTDLAACLLPLLTALGWRGHSRHIAESLPHFAETMDITGLRNVMANLHFESHPLKTRMDLIDARLLPCLFIPDDGNIMVILSMGKEKWTVFDSCSVAVKDIPPNKIKGTSYFFSSIDKEERQRSSQVKEGWFRAVRERFNRLVYQILGITLALNLLALATPLFVMAVYDKVISSGSLSTLAFLAIGVAIAMICDFILRAVRARVLAFVGARFDTILGNSIFERIMFLPSSFTEKATVGAQLSRIKNFETVRNFFTGSMSLVVFELPFVIIFIIAIAMVGGVLALIPLVMVAVFVLVGVVMSSITRRFATRAGRAGSKRQEFIVESLSSMRAIRTAGIERRWLERFRELSAAASMAGFHTSQISSIVNTISHILMIVAGVATISLGVFRVFSGDMSIGGVVASMILVWRVLSPLQTGFTTLSRVSSVRNAITQIDSLMSMKPERDPYTQAMPLKRFEGRVSFSRVAIRYSADSDPALVGVNFDVEPGDVVALIGGNGSGKSTIFKLLLGMQIPQAGTVRIDNWDIRQMDSMELRHAIGYAPQHAEFFYGTIAQNLRLAHSTASDEDIRWAAEQVGALDEIMALEQGTGKWARTGFDVRIGDSRMQLSNSLLQRINLARAFVKRPSILLLDEPGSGLDFAGDQLLAAAINRLRGSSTIFMITHRPGHLRLVDKVIWLEKGIQRAAGPLDQVRSSLPKEFGLI